MISVQKCFVCVCQKSSNDIYIFKIFAERFWKKIRLPVLANASVSVKMKPAFAMLSLSQVIIRTYCLDKGGLDKNNIEIINENLSIPMNENFSLFFQRFLVVASSVKGKLMLTVLVLQRLSSFDRVNMVLNASQSFV